MPLVEASSKSAKVERRCMSCGRALNPDAKDLYSRRFCSNECKESYLRK